MKELSMSDLIACLKLIENKLQTLIELNRMNPDSKGLELQLDEVSKAKALFNYEAWKRIGVIVHNEGI